MCYYLRQTHDTYLVLMSGSSSLIKNAIKILTVLSFPTKLFLTTWAINLEASNVDSSIGSGGEVYIFLEASDNS